jgi:2-polyprenyl-3-methyl-5-hydroxy-6-metoxy-1,4-benzoquinol methylase
MIRRLIYDFWYLTGRTPWDTGISPPELLATLEHTSAGRALDLGCGTGTNAITMAERGWQVVGVDFSRRAILQARRKARRANLEIEFHQHTVTALQHMQEPFDLVLDIGCFHGLAQAERASYAAHITRLLHPLGTYLLYSWIGDPVDPALARSTETDIISLFAPALAPLSVDYGTDHQHTAAWFTFRRPT